MNTRLGVMMPTLYQLKATEPYPLEFRRIARFSTASVPGSARKKTEGGLAAPRPARVNLENEGGGPCCGRVLPTAAIGALRQYRLGDWRVTRPVVA